MSKEQDTIRQKIRSIKSLPTLPTVAQKISKMAESDKTSATELGKVIGTDQALSGKVLRLVNSSFYGFPGRISSVSNAIILLGFNVVKSLVVSVSVFEMMEKGIVGLWQHSLGCALASGIIARKIKQPEPEEISVAGLLHDIGKVVVSIQLRDSYEQIQALIMDEKKSFYSAEKEILELTHADIGSWLADSWNLPLNLREPIAYHHQPDKAQRAKTQTAIIHLGNLLVRASGFGSGGDPWVPPLCHRAWESLGLTMTQLEGIIHELAQELEALDSTAMFEHSQA